MSEQRPIEASGEPVNGPLLYKDLLAGLVYGAFLYGVPTMIAPLTMVARPRHLGLALLVKTNKQDG